MRERGLAGGERGRAGGERGRVGGGRREREGGGGGGERKKEIYNVHGHSKHSSTKMYMCLKNENTFNQKILSCLKNV